MSSRLRQTQNYTPIPQRNTRRKKDGQLSIRGTTAVLRRNVEFFAFPDVPLTRELSFNEGSLQEDLHCMENYSMK